MQLATTILDTLKPVATGAGVALIVILGPLTAVTVRYAIIDRWNRTAEDK